MKLLESVDMVRHAMPNLNLEQQQGMIQDIAVSINNIRNGLDKQSLATERWQKVCKTCLKDVVVGQLLHENVRVRTCCKLMLGSKVAEDCYCLLTFMRGFGGHFRVFKRDHLQSLS